MHKRATILTTLIIFLLFSPSFGGISFADHQSDTLPFCGDGIVEEGEKCTYDVGVTTQCWKEGAKIGVGNHYQLGELCLGYDQRTKRSTGESGVCIANSNCWIGGDELQGTPSRIVIPKKTVGLEEYIPIYIYDPGRGQMRGYQTDANLREVIEGPDHYLSNFCNGQAPCVHNNEKGSSLLGDRHGKWCGYVKNCQPGVLVKVTDFKDWFEKEPTESEKNDWYMTRPYFKPHIPWFAIKEPGKYVLSIWDARGNHVESEPFIVCSDEFCETTEVMGSVSDGHGFFVPDMEVLLSQETDNASKDLVFTTYTDENGWYFFDELIDKERPIRLTFSFKGKPDQSDRDRFEIRDLKAEEGSTFNTDDRPVSATTKDIEIDAVPEIFDFVRNLDLIESANINSFGQLDDFARTHILTATALWFFEDALETVLHDPKPLTIYGNPRSSGSYYTTSRHAFYLASDDVLWDDFDEPDNGVWHEISHALHYSALTGGKNVMPNDRHGYGGYNHMGYANPGTADSYTEGFAMFMSSVMQNELEFKEHEGDEPWIYRYSVSSTFNLEDNLKVWESMGRREDMAISNLLWDLYDDGAMYGGPDDDNVSLPIETIWKALNDKEVRDVKDIFDAFSLIVPLLDLEKIFVSHGVFHDANGDYKHDRGEEIGVARPGLAFLVNWDFYRDGGRIYDVDAIVGRWLLAGTNAESAPAGAGPSVPRWGSADIDNDKDIAGLVLSADGLSYDSGVVDKDNDVDYGLLTDMDGDGKAEMTEQPFWSLPYDARRSFVEFREEQIKLNVTDEAGSAVAQTYLVMKYQYPEGRTHLDYETRALVPGDAPISMWIPEGATLSMHAVAGDFESEEISIDHITFVNNLVPYGDQGEAALQIPTDNAKITSAISAEQAQAEKDAVTKGDSGKPESQGERYLEIMHILILAIILGVGYWVYRRKKEKKNN